jgi:hypothetical protein
MNANIVRLVRYIRTGSGEQYVVLTKTQRRKNVELHFALHWWRHGG